MQSPKVEQEEDSESGPSEETISEDKQKKDQLQKEKDALRAPFSELTNTNK